VPDETEILLDKDWSLSDLGLFSDKYIQVYSFFYSIVEASDEHRKVYQQYPWRGGYSTVNFYWKLNYSIPRENRPQIKKIRYASPGEITLTQIRDVAIAAAATITAVSIAAGRANKIYSDVMKGISERKLSKINLRREEMQLSLEELQFIAEAKKLLQEQLAITEDNARSFEEKTDSNSLMQLKILLSVFRRVEPLSKLVTAGKISFSKIFRDQTHANRDQPAPTRY